MKYRIAEAVLLVFISLALFCIRCTSEHAVSHKNDRHASFIEKIRIHDLPEHDQEHAIREQDSTLFLTVAASIPGIEDFYTEKRMQSITSFPCSNCHNQPLKAMQTSLVSRQPKAHWNIELNHADESAMNCTTCHGGENMNSLTSLTGKEIHIDESFRLCGQCHSTQFKDWQGGAHGKQLYGWKPPRVIKTCVGCHNPHQPAFPKRFPARLNTIQLEE